MNAEAFAGFVLKDPQCLLKGGLLSAFSGGLITANRQTANQLIPASDTPVSAWLNTPHNFTFSPILNDFTYFKKKKTFI